ncbi:unnamed protein product, partial [marine sediment metagenome]
MLSRTPVLFVPERWEPIRLHKISEDIAERTKEPKLILTLVPLLALEGGCDIYSELSCGAIIYRVGDSLSESDRQRTHTTGMETLAGLLEKKPPSAVILGMEGLLSSMQTDMISRIVSIPSIHIRSVMIPVNKVQMVEVNCDKSGLLKKLEKCAFTRLPVYDSQPTNIVGFVNIYEALSTSEQFTDLQKLVK